MENGDQFHADVHRHHRNKLNSSNSSMTPAGSDIGKQSDAPDDGWKHRPKYVERTRNNKLTYKVALVDLQIDALNSYLFTYNTFINTLWTGDADLRF